MAAARFPAELTSAGEARRFVASTLDGLTAVEVIDVAVLLTSELVTNAVVHAGSWVEVAVSTPDAAVRVAVSDESDARPLLEATNDLREGGRGLALVGRLADAWDVTATGRGKTVWFSVRAP